MCFLWFLILIGVREVGEIHLSADLPVVFGDLDLAGSHIDAHHHLRVDCFGSCELGRDSDLGSYHLAGFVRRKFNIYRDLALSGCFCVRILNIFSHLHERLVEFLGEGSACESFEVDLCLYFLLFHVLTSLPQPIRLYFFRFFCSVSSRRLPELRRLSAL